MVTRTVLVGASGGLVGPFLEPDDADLGWSRLLVLNDAPDIVAEALVVDEGSRGDPCVPYTVQVIDQDGINASKSIEGTLTPLGEQAGWVTMRNDGLGPDEAAGDDVWSACLDVRTGTPSGLMELLIRASDTYGEGPRRSPPSCARRRRRRGGGQNDEIHRFCCGAVSAFAVLVVGLLVGLSRREGGGVTGLGTAEGASTHLLRQPFILGPGGTDAHASVVAVITRRCQR